MITQQLSLFTIEPETTTPVNQQQLAFDCRFCKDTGKLGRYAFCFCETGKEKQKERLQRNVIDDARQLSSGTIATLTGLTRYEDIDQIRADFVSFLADRPQPHGFECWQDAWEAWQDAWDTTWQNAWDAFTEKGE